jgi:hypothetical protein
MGLLSSVRSVENREYKHEGMITNYTSEMKGTWSKGGEGYAFPGIHNKPPSADSCTGNSNTQQYFTGIG